MKSDNVFRRTYNLMLDTLSALEPGTKLPSEVELGEKLQVSRTTVRKVVDRLSTFGYVTGSGRTRAVGLDVANAPRFPDPQTLSIPEQIEAKFMAWIQKGDTKPGTAINELELARDFGVATTGIREFLNQFQRFGLIERRASGGWIFNGFTRSFAVELFEIREMFELRSAQAFGRLPEDSPAWIRLERLREAHVKILNNIKHSFQKFSELDSRFHSFIHTARPNRFIDGFNDVNALIFHYHYQWNKVDERQRNEVALTEHLTYIDALFTRNPAIIDLACRAHLNSARDTLLRSTQSRVSDN